MAVSAAQVAVGAAAVALNTAGTAGMTLVVTNTGAGTVALGPAGVTAGTGLVLAANATVSVTLAAGEVLFAIQASAAATVHVLRTQA